MKKLLGSLVTIGLIGGFAVFLTSSFFSDTETSQGNVLQAGSLDLEIDNESYYNGVLNTDTTWTLADLTNQLFFNFLDLKPDDFGEDTISLHAENDFWACMEINVTKNDDVTCTEPELEDDPNCAVPGEGLGELGDAVNFVWWPDDGDNVLEADEEPFIKISSASAALNQSITLADSTDNVWTGNPGPLSGGTTHYIGKAWCFGTLGTSPLAENDYESPADDNNNNATQGEPEDGGLTCDGTFLDNATQTDSLMGDVSFTAFQARHNESFLCNPPDISCAENAIIYASSFSDNDQGLRKDSTAVLANRSVPSAAFGAPQTSGADSDVGFPARSFFSLGFPLSGNTASIVFGFAEPFYPNPSGPDLQVFEVTGGIYPDEKVKVEASSAAVGPWTVLSASATRDEDIELGILPSAQFVRLTDVSDINLFSGTGDATPDGYDVDALKAFCTVVED